MTGTRSQQLVVATWLPVLAVTLAALVVVAPLASARTGVVEDWEDSQPLSEWTSESGRATVQSDTVINGTQDLQLDDDNIYSSGLSTRPERGDVWEVPFILNASNPPGRMRIQFAEQNGDTVNSGYMIEWDKSAGNIELKDTADGTTLASTSVDLSQEFGEVLRLEISWSDNIIKVTLYGPNGKITSLSGEDKDLNSGGLELGSSNGITYFGDIELIGDAPVQTIELRNVSAPSNLVTQSMDVTFYYDNGDVITKSTSDGTVDVSSLTINDTVQIVVEGGDYYRRRTILKDLSQNNDVYMLPTTATRSDISFQLDDSTGLFGENTVVYIQRPISLNGNTKYRTVAAGQVGANGEVPVNLETGQRYRIIVRNDGRQRILGPYLASGDVDPEILPIGKIQLQGDAGEGVGVTADVRNVSDVRVLRIQFLFPEANGAEIRYNVTRASNSSHVIVNNTTITDPGVRTLVTHNLTKLDPNAASGTAYEICYELERDDGTVVSGCQVVGQLRNVGSQIPFDPQIQALLSYVGIIATTGMVALYDPKLATITGVVVAGILLYTGWVAIPLPLFGVAGAAALLHNVGGRVQ